MSHTKQKALLFSVLLSAVVAQYGSAPLPAQLPPSHRPPPPLFGGQTPKKHQHKPMTQSVPIFKPSLGLGPLPVPSGLGPLPLPAGQVSMSMPSYSYGNPSNGLPSSFQQLPQPSFQSQRPWQPAPSFNSVAAPQMNFAAFAGQQGVPQSYGVPSIYLQQPSMDSVPSKFLSPPPPPSFPAPASFAGVPPSNAAMQPSFPAAQTTQYTPSMPSYGNGPYMMQMQQNPESFSFDTVPQREVSPQSNGPSPQTYYPSQFGPSGSSPSYGSVESPQQFQMSSMSSQTLGPVSSPQLFAIPASQQSFGPSDSAQSYSPAQSYHASQVSGPVESQQSFGPVESQQMFGPSSSSQSFALASSAHSYAQSNAGASQVESPSDMQSNVQIFGIAPPSQQQGSSEYQQSHLQMNLPPVRQEPSAESLLPVLHQSAVALASSHYPPGPESAGPSSGSPYDGSIFTRYVRVSDTFPSA